MQFSILNFFKEEYEFVKKNKYNYDYIIFDRTHEDTKVFTKLNINDDKYTTFLAGICEKINTPSFDKVIYLKPTMEIMLQRQKSRSRPGETNDEEYLKKLYNLYDEMIDEIYTDYITFENNSDISEYRVFLKTIFLK